MTTTTTARIGIVRRLAAIVIATAAMMIGLVLAGSAAHADTVVGNSVFGSSVECAGDDLYFTVTSDEVDGSYAQVWVYDPYVEEWVTDGNWVEANYYSTYNLADLTFEPGYYEVYVAYAQWNGYDFDFSGEYIDTYEQYYSIDDHETSDYCYLGY
jgi:hypothetical protein